jgi:ubiquinone biosynthesis protein UbiJ
VFEAAVHRWDMQKAAGADGPSPIDPEVAADGVDELLAITLPWCANAEKPLPGSVHLHCTDVAGEWFVAPDATVERAHAKADVAVRATASDLLLALYKRAPVERLELSGDAELVRQFVQRLDTT